MEQLRISEAVKQMRPKEKREILFHAIQNECDRQIANAAGRKSANSRRNLLALIGSVLGGGK